MFRFDPGSANFDRRVEVRLAGELSSLARIRTIVVAYCVFVGLDEDGLSDLRLAVDEAATALIAASEDAHTRLELGLILVGDSVAVEVSTDAHVDGDPLGDFNRRLLDALADDVRSFSLDAGERTVTGISMTSKPPVA